jgi:hypothetical protein
MWDSLTRDLVLSLVSGLIGFFAKKIWDAIKDQLHSRRIYSWMQAQSRIPGAPTFRSTKTIASHTNLTQERVTELCSRHSKIYLSVGDKDGRWSISKRRESGFFDQS